MKSLYLFLLLSIPCFIYAQISIPDANFKSKLLSQNLELSALVARDLNNEPLIIDANNNGQIEASEALNVSSLRVVDAGIQSIEGIQFFLNLKALTCYNNQITTLMYNLPLLESLWCGQNQLTQVDLHYFPLLSTLDCNSNQISTLDFRGHEMKFVYCSENAIHDIFWGTFSDGAYIEISSNQLTSLEIAAPGKNLHRLDFSSNPITHFVVEAKSFDHFICMNTSLTELDLSQIERGDYISMECTIKDNMNLHSISFKNAALDFCIPPVGFNCSESTFTLQNNPTLVSVCADEGTETTYLQPFATALGFTLNSDCDLATKNNVDIYESALYPNPAESFVTIHSNFKIDQAQIFNTLGQIVKTSVNRSQKTDLTVFVDDLKPGTYFVTIASDTGKTTKKFIKL